MSNIRFPPIAALRALETAARHLSYTKAAEELHITQSAVSHQIRHAEELWGLKLFERRGRRLILTQNGQALVPVVRTFINGLISTLEDLKDEDSHDSLRVTLLQSFAFKWLVPRLGHFNQERPEIDVWISTTEELVDFSLDNADMGIRLGHGDWPELHVTPLLKEYVFPVCSPHMLEKFGMPSSPHDLFDYPLLRRSAMDICPRWRDWFRDAGIQIKRIPKGGKFPDT
ncbi:MAG: LysR substrate-binding domain-containing protein, partial [Gammaproteobacteria bacterium]|nr:LysR substrate-binding domain-containing protein [Gammaproteobacteria bacterium]